MATSNPQCTFTAPLTPKSNPDIKLPKFIYGTAWKKDKTSNLVYQALKAGFRAIDTAAQPRHYNEAHVGLGISKSIQDQIVKREDIYIQTKYTPPSGQDPRNMPYDVTLALEDQIHTSITSSLSHFNFEGTGEPYIDCLVLHSPLSTLPETLRAWTVFESYVPSKIRSLGISNTTLIILKAINSEMAIRPSVVQNRFHSATNYEVVLRDYCRDQGIIFQSFWTLTGNTELAESELVKTVAAELKTMGIKDEKAVALYSLVMGLEGITVLNGTTNGDRMENDLKGLELISSLIEGEWKVKWGEWMEHFKHLVGEL